MREAFYDTNGITLNVREYAGDGPALMLLPGLTANACFFNSLVDAGLAPRHRIVAVNLRGRGRSEKPPGDYSMATHAADVLGLMDKLKIDQALLGGHSYGGLLTYYLAANHPDRVAKAVVLDAPAEVDPTVLEQIRPALARLEKVYPTWDEFIDEMKRLPYYDGWWDPGIEEYFRADVTRHVDGRCRPRSHPRHMEMAVEGTLEIDWPATVARITCPTLLVRCTDAFGPAGFPPLLPADAARRTVDLLTDGQLVEAPGNHMTAFFGESAGTLAQHMIDFLDD